MAEWLKAHLRMLSSQSTGVQIPPTAPVYGRAELTGVDPRCYPHNRDSREATAEAQGKLQRGLYHQFKDKAPW